MPRFTVGDPDASLSTSAVEKLSEASGDDADDVLLPPPLFMRCCCIIRVVAPAADDDDDVGAVNNKCGAR